MTNPMGMAQSFSLSNMMPQARQNNQGIWAKNVEEPTRLYAKRATGDLYVFTGSTGKLGTIGRGSVTVPSHLYKLVYDPSKKKAWAYWVENTNEADMMPPISYIELIQKTGIDFHLPIEIADNTKKYFSKTPSPKKQILGGWYPVFFDQYAPGKVNEIIASINNGKVASLQIQYDSNLELAKQIGTEIESQTSMSIRPIQSSPPESTSVSYERNRVAVIIYSK